MTHEFVGSQLTHVAICMPAGQCLDDLIGAPRGFSEFRQRLIYRQSSCNDYRFDRLGMKFGNNVNSEVGTILVQSAPEDASGVAEAVIKWLLEPEISRNLLNEEKNSLADQFASYTGSSERTVWKEALRKLGVDSHLYSELALSDDLLGLTFDEVNQFLNSALQHGIAIFSLGLEDPFEGQAPSVLVKHWQPGKALMGEYQPSAEGLDSLDRSKLGFLSVRPGPGAATSRILATVMPSSVLKYGRSLPAQKRLHEYLGIHELRFEWMAFAKTSFLIARGSSPGPIIGEIVRLAEEAIGQAQCAEGSWQKKVGLYELKNLIDDPSRRVMFEARQILYGGPSLLQLAEELENMPVECVQAMCRRELSSISSVMLSSQVSRLALDFNV